LEIGRAKLAKTMRGIRERKKGKSCLQLLYSGDLAENLTGSFFSDTMTIPLPSFVQIHPVSNYRTSAKMFSEQLQYSGRQ